MSTEDLRVRRYEQAEMEAKSHHSDSDIDIEGFEFDRSVRTVGSAKRMHVKKEKHHPPAIKTPTSAVKDSSYYYEQSIQSDSDSEDEAHKKYKKRKEDRKNKQNSEKRLGTGYSCVKNYSGQSLSRKLKRKMLQMVLWQIVIGLIVFIICCYVQNELGNTPYVHHVKYGASIQSLLWLDCISAILVGLFGSLILHYWQSLLTNMFIFKIFVRLYQLATVAVFVEFSWCIVVLFLTFRNIPSWSANMDLERFHSCYIGILFFEFPFVAFTFLLMMDVSFFNREIEYHCKQLADSKHTNPSLASPIDEEDSPLPAYYLSNKSCYDVIVFFAALPWIYGIRFLGHTFSCCEDLQITVSFYYYLLMRSCRKTKKRMNKQKPLKKMMRKMMKRFHRLVTVMNLLNWNLIRRNSRVNPINTAQEESLEKDIKQEENEKIDESFEESSKSLSATAAEASKKQQLKDLLRSQLENAEKTEKAKQSKLKELNEIERIQADKDRLRQEKAELDRLRFNMYSHLKESSSGLGGGDEEQQDSPSSAAVDVKEVVRSMTRESFKQRWEELLLAGSFDCKVTVHPVLSQLVMHFQRQRFNVIYSEGDSDSFDEIGIANIPAGPYDNLFLAKFRYYYDRRVFSCEIKCQNTDDMPKYVKNFLLAKILKIDEFGYEDMV